ncbi:MAG: 4-alpha-glucanotransferase, partial [Clostridiales bacterium]|nr:4-alpha-glucanotransferase [Clostridiales bacterium]
AYDSAEVWARKELFLLRDGEPAAVAGVPPDYFSADGQKWGNPLYDWSNRDKVFAFWKERIAHALTLFDVLRIDHFRAFADYYAVPAENETAKFGEWHDGPSTALFEYLETELGELPLIAEDLGELSEKARALPVLCGFPGMKVLQFGLLGDQKSNPHAIRNFTKAFVGYTGTHDNDTALGWYSSLSAGEQAQVRARLGSGNVALGMIKRLYKSRVRTAIVPIQDFLQQGSSYRTNTPGTLGGNWQYRLSEIPPLKTADSIRALGQKYNRAV